MPAGIDFGYSTTKIAARINREIVLIPNAEGRLEIPSKVRIAGKHFYFGEKAVQMPSNGGQIFNLWDILALPDAEYEGKMAFIIQCWFSYLLQSIQSWLPEKNARKPLKLVLVLPSHTSHQTTARIRQAAAQAGFDLLRFLSSGSAAFLEKEYFAPGSETKRFFVDCGAQHLVISAAEFDHGSVEMGLEYSLPHMGGEKIDLALCALAISALFAQDQIRITRDGQLSSAMQEEAQRIKNQLSYQEQAQFHYPFGLGSQTMTITRSDLKPMLKPITQEIMNAWQKSKQVLQGKADEVIIQGALSKNPVIQETLQNCLSKKIPPFLIDSHCLAKGALIQAGILDGTITGIFSVSCTPRSLYVHCTGSKPRLLFPAGTYYPSTKTFTFSNSMVNWNQPAFFLSQPEQELEPGKEADDSTRFETLCRIDLPGNQTGADPIVMRAEIDSSMQCVLYFCRKDKLLIQSEPVSLW